MRNRQRESAAACSGDRYQGVYWFDVSSLEFPDRSWQPDENVQFVREFGSAIHPYIADSLGHLLQPLVFIVQLADGLVSVRTVELRREHSLARWYDGVTLEADAVAVVLGRAEVTVEETQRDHDVTVIYACVVSDVLTVSLQ
jgi:hypothetical protein